jgi:hypothetical protein
MYLELKMLQQDTSMVGTRGSKGIKQWQVHRGEVKSLPVNEGASMTNSSP